MVLSCLRGYHLRCLRPSLLPDSEPLVERDEIIAVLQNPFSLSPRLSLSLFPQPPRVAAAVGAATATTSRSERIIIATLGYAFIPLSVIGDVILRATVSDESETAYAVTRR